MICPLEWHKKQPKFVFANGGKESLFASTGWSWQENKRLLIQEHIVCFD